MKRRTLCIFKILILTALFCCAFTDVYAQTVTLGNNLLYDATLTPNLRVGLRLAPHWSVGMTAGYRPWPVGEDVSSYYTLGNDGTYSAATGTAVDGTTYYEKKDVLGADIRGNVYGGGNNAEVTGDSKVKISKKNEGD